MRAIRMISTEIYEPHGTEAYLEEMDRKGYHLDAAGKFLFYFDRTEPQDMRYHVECWKDELPDEIITQYKECGWEYVDQAQRDIYIFRAPAGTPLPEPFDWGLRRDQYRRYMRRAVWLNLLLAGFVLALMIGLCMWADVGAYFDPGNSWWITLATATLILAFVYTIFQIIHARRYWKHMGESEQSGNIRLYRMGSWLAIWFLTMYFCVLGVQVVDLFQQSNHEPANYVPLSQMSEQLDARDLPYFTLDGLGAPDGQTWEERSGVYLHEPLTREQYAWDSKTNEENWRDRTHLGLAYYDVRIPLTDRILVKSIHVDEAQPVQTDAFDDLYRYQDEDYLHLTARLGRVVVDMTYRGKDPDKAESLFYETFGR